MVKLISIFVVCMLALLCSASAVTTFDPVNKGGNITLCAGNVTAVYGGQCGAQVFTPLHTYYMSPSGSDANSGTDAAHPWASPNHAVVCGDVIIAAAGTYANDMSVFGTVSSCPSTSGGIDGTGGIYAAVMLCGGSDITSCVVNCATTSPCNGANSIQAGININKSNWAVEGWQVTAGATLSGQGAIGIQTDGCAGVHHDNYVINNLIFNVGQAYDTQDCNNVGAFGSDYVAVIGMIAQNANQANFAITGYCIAAIDVIRPGQFDSVNTTHFFIYNNYVYNNLEPSCSTHFDGESFMYDTLDGHSLTSKLVTANNLAFYATRYCINFTYGSPAAPLIKVYNNTCFDHNQQTSSADTVAAEFYITGCTGTLDIFNNIGYQPRATGPGGPDLYAAMSNPSCTLNIGAVYATGAENIYKGSATVCDFTCDPGNNVSEAGGSTFGTNTYVNPAFQNTTDLLANQLGAPSCSGFINTTQCMGWNANTRALTTPGIISDLIGTAVGSAPYYSMVANKGFQLPNTTCLTGGEIFNDYPPHLKGLVYLHYNSTSGVITENADLASKPCGM